MSPTFATNINVGYIFPAKLFNFELKFFMKKKIKNRTFQCLRFK